jgi:HlyD family type I secretion membrane fusion protein
MSAVKLLDHGLIEKEGWVRETRPLRRWGRIFILAFFGGFFAWSIFAPLQSAVIAPAVIIVDGSSKEVQHLEGGIVEALYIRAGDEVSLGQELIRLDDTQAKAQYELLQAQFLASSALIARLEAERDRSTSINFPDWLIEEARSNEAAEDAVEGQTNIFEARSDSIHNQVEILEQQNNQIEAEIDGLEKEIAAQDLQLALVAEEIEGVELMFRKGLERKPRLLSLQRGSASIEGDQAQNIARVARARQQIGENQLRAIELQTQFRNETVELLREEQNRHSDLSERLRAAKDVLDRSIIRAPSSGVIVELNEFTVGGVIAPRETIMKIVPRGEPLAVEAQVAVEDIDSIAHKMPVELRFGSVNRRNPPIIDGLVQFVSADRLINEQTQIPYYEARISIDEEQATREGVNLAPGMPVEAMILTGEQTAMDYFLKPLLQSINRSLREE